MNCLDSQQICSPKIVFLICFVTIILCSIFTTPPMMIATFNFCLLLLGFSFRHRSKSVHASLMTLGILSDISLVLLLQIQRNAVQTAVAFRLSPLNQAHVICSTLATLLYFPVLFYGWKLYQNTSARGNTRLIHKRLGLAALFFRTLGFLLMFSMLKPNQ